MFNKSVLECHDHVIFQCADVLLDAANVVQRGKRTELINTRIKGLVNIRTEHPRQSANQFEQDS